MKNLKIVFYIVFLFFVIYTPHLAFGQQNASTIVNNATINTKKPFDLSGIYIADNQDKYFLKQVGNSLWWIGTDKNDSDIKNIFKGIIDGGNITGQWVDSPLKKTIGNGSLNMIISFNSIENITINIVPSSNNDKFPINQLIKFNSKIQVIPQFMVTINSINVEKPRSPLYDVLFMGLSVKKDNNDPITATRYLANREANSNITLNLMLGPFVFDKKDTGLTIEFVGVNKDDPNIPSNLINLEESLIQLSDPSFSSYDISNAHQADQIIRSLSPTLLNNGCNGLVFSDKVFIPLADLKKILSSGTYSQEKSYAGTESPLGCGPNSKYQVKWSIVPIG